jgi:hypothetical protein
MIEYKYIQQIDFKLPDMLLDKVIDLGPVPPAGRGPVRMPVYKQINWLLYQKRFATISLYDKEQDERANLSRSDLITMGDRLDAWDPEWRDKITEFRETELTGQLAQDIVDCLPKDLQRLRPVVSLQTRGAGGYITPPHTDHHRTCTLWCLLQGNDEQTVWWETVKDFKEYEFWSFADPTCIQEAKRATLQKNTWYVFDNSSYHSVDTINESAIDRTSLCIEFNCISAEHLYNLYQETK